MAVVERFASDADNLYVVVTTATRRVDFVVAHLHTALANEWKAAAAPTPGVLCRAFAKIDKMLAQAGRTRGTTANVVVCSRAGAYRSRTLLAANVGDSRTPCLRRRRAAGAAVGRALARRRREVERVHAAAAT